MKLRNPVAAHVARIIRRSVLMVGTTEQSLSNRIIIKSKDNQYLKTSSKWLVSLHLLNCTSIKDTLLLMVEIFRRAKVTNFSFGDSARTWYNLVTKKDSTKNFEFRGFLVYHLFNNGHVTCPQSWKSFNNYFKSYPRGFSWHLQKIISIAFAVFVTNFSTIRGLVLSQVLLTVHKQ